jgi:biotin carboxyl carrier protein
MQYTYEYNGQTYTVHLERKTDGTLLARVDDREYVVDAAQLASGGWLLRMDGTRYFAHSVGDTDARHVHLNGVQYRLEKVNTRRRKRTGSGSGGDLTAQMPGQVIDVRVQDGDVVQAGQVLLVLEAMKMEIRISAPLDGVVTRLLVKQGDLVERGQLLAEVVAHPEA